MPRNVQVARNALAGMGVLMVCGGLFMLFSAPTHWQNYIEQLFGALFTFYIVRQVSRGEGDWRNSASLLGMVEPTKDEETQGE